MLRKEKLTNEKLVNNIEYIIKEKYDFLSHQYLIGKNDEVYVFAEEFQQKYNRCDFHQCFLYEIAKKDGQIYLHKVLKCEYEFVELFVDSPYLNIELLLVSDKSKLNKGLGTTVISYLEHLATEKNCYAVQGTFLPLRPAKKEDVKFFYERNGYQISFGGKDNHLRKESYDLRHYNEEKIGDISVINTALSNKELNKSNDMEK